MAAQGGQTTRHDEWWSGLHLGWDNSPDVRSRIRDGSTLMLPHPCLGISDGAVDGSVHNCRFNKQIPASGLETLAQAWP